MCAARLRSQAGCSSALPIGGSERDQEKWNPVFLKNRATKKESRAAMDCGVST
jgi:hypothetical protein